jgi:type I restriction enzyme S subunit
MEVREPSARYLRASGYKQTEAGVVPIDWLEHTVGDLIAFEGGSQPDKSVFSPTLKPGYVRLVQIRDYKTDRFETYVPRSLARRFCTENDIMIGRYGPPIFQILRGLSGAYNVALIKAKPHDEINRDYAYYFLTQEKLFTFIEKLSQRSSGQTGIDLKELRTYPLPLPPTKAEQAAIAEALSDADALIESLSRLLAKKRHLKQGAMQQLLTGKKRLPGFSGDWELKALNEIATASKGSQLLSSDMTEHGRFAHLNGGISPSGYTERSNAPGDTIAISEGGNSCGYVQFMFRPYWCGGHCYSVIPNGVDNRFLYQALKGEELSIMSLRVGSGLPNVQKTALLAFKLRYPKSIEEQTAIAAILADMDAGIAALEEKFTKAHNLKQGMMQALLTGRIRLV